MRVFVFLLILANLLFLAWTQGYFGAPANLDAFRVQQQLQPERLRVVARGEPPPEPLKPEVAMKAPETPAAAGITTSPSGATNTTCLVVAELPLADAEKLESVLAEKLAMFQIQRTSVAASGSYWVNIPPLANKQQADSKAAELKKLNVPEFFVVNESGPNNLAISLGLFSSKEAAAVRMDMLRDKGVRSAKITERNVKPASVSLELKGPEDQIDTLRQLISVALPEARSEMCKRPVANGQ